MYLLISRLIISGVICLFAFFALKATWTRNVNVLRWIQEPAEAFVPEDKISNGEKIDAMASKLDDFFTQRDLDKSQKEQIIILVERAEKPQRERLKERYELGYALIHADGTELSCYTPHETKQTIDWPATKVGSVSKDTVTVQLPGEIRFGNQVFIDCRVTVGRRTGAVGRLVEGSSAMIVECLEASDQTIIMVVGLTENYDRQKLGIN